MRRRSLRPSSVPATHNKSQRNAFLIPMDKRNPIIRIRTRQAEELSGKPIVVTIDAWDRISRFPAGHFVRSLGEMDTLLTEYVQCRPCPEAVLDSCRTRGRVAGPGISGGPGVEERADFRDLLVHGIDPPGCQAIDDALHSGRRPNGNYEVGVHIADVTISSSRIPHWTKRPRQEGQPYTLLTNASTCC